MLWYRVALAAQPEQSFSKKTGMRYSQYVLYIKFKSCEIIVPTMRDCQISLLVIACCHRLGTCRNMSHCAPDSTPFAVSVAAIAAAANQRRAADSDCSCRSESSGIGHSWLAVASDYWWPQNCLVGWCVALVSAHSSSSFAACNSSNAIRPLTAPLKATAPLE